MRIHLRILAITLAVSLSYGGFVLACPEWTRELGLDLWNSYRDSDDLAAHQRDRDRLNVVGERVLKRVHMKEDVVHDLIDDRVDLADATEQFIALNEMEPELMTHVRQHFAGANDRERTAHQVMVFARTMLNTNPSREEIVMKRLELEYQTMKGKQPVQVVH